MFNVFRNAVHFIGIANNTVVEPWLPCKRDGVFVSVTGDGTF